MTISRRFRGYFNRIFCFFRRRSKPESSVQLSLKSSAFRLRKQRINLSPERRPADIDLNSNSEKMRREAGQGERAGSRGDLLTVLHWQACQQEILI